MSSQTARPPRRPDNQRQTRSARTRKYSRQTAHVEARRDGKPLIFNWGAHLSRNEKNQLQRRAVWASTIVTAIIIVAVIVGYWVNINVITPGKAITSVNGEQIPQSTYRKLVALKAQIEANKIYGKHGLNAQRDDYKQKASAQQQIIDNATKQIDDANKQLKALPAGPSIERTNLTVQITSAQQQLQTAQALHDALLARYQDLVSNGIPNELQLYNQSQIGNDSADWLQDDVFIRSWLANQSSTVYAQIEPNDAAVTTAIQNFINNIPSTSSYSKFLSNSNISNDDAYAMMRVVVRRQNMQTYLASQIKSPTYQVLARAMTISTLQDANSVLKQLKNGGDFAKLAKAKSVDVATKDKGGDLGWLSRGQYAQNTAANQSGLIDNWIFDPSRKLGEISPVLTENGAYHIIQILNVDPARAVDDTTLQALKTNALTAWLLSQKALPGVKITPIDQTMLLDPLNMPTGLPASSPQQTPAAGLPGGSLPGSGLPGNSGLPTTP